jgi:CRISPR/Cas system-associated exonuclease Cas4 (RecB family)
MVKKKKTTKKKVSGKKKSILPKSIKKTNPLLFPDEPLWKGPEVDGITQSMLNSYLTCKERFRLSTVLGIGKPEEFNSSIEYGNMWHECEDAHASKNPWKLVLEKYARSLIKKFPSQQEAVVKWYNVALVQFPLYIKYWEKHSHVKNRKCLLQEVSFKVPYLLPSGRTVFLRGKWDSVDLVLKKSGKKFIPNGLWLQENKTKGTVKEELIRRQLLFDKQVMVYVIALHEELQRDAVGLLGADYGPLTGVRYNVIRRPLSGGTGSIRPHKATSKKPAETLDHYYARLREKIQENQDSFFLRWEVKISTKDIEDFKTRFLTPILEEISAWYDMVTDYPKNPFLSDGRAHHYQSPYGTYNPISMGSPTPFDDYLATGSLVGLERRKTVFPELEE